MKDLLKSKKARMTLAGAIASLLTYLGGKWGMDLDDKTAMQLAMGILAIFGTFVGAQGIADHGKERAKVEKGE